MQCGTINRVQVNIEAKSLLAKLMATENIWVRHQNVETAAFDLVNRTLILPIWDNVSDVLYTLLVGHEVAHALYDERTTMADLGKRIDPKNPKVASMYWNVVADARGERLIKQPYPGLRRIFSAGYKELFDKGFFGVQDVDTINKMNLIDRINIHFKLGHLVEVDFAPDEQVFVAKVEQTLSQADVVSVAKEIYDWAKQNENEEQLPQSLQDLIDELSGTSDPKDSDREEDGNPSKNDPPKKTSKPKPSKAPKKKFDKKDASEDGDDSNSTSEDKAVGGISETENGTEVSKDSSLSETNANGEETSATKTEKTPLTPVDPGSAPMSITQAALEEHLQSIQDKTTNYVYLSTPTPNLKNIVEGYKSVHARIRKSEFYTTASSWEYFRNKRPREAVFTQAEREFIAFRKSNAPKVDYLFQQFEMRKQADRYARTLTHKTGALDTLRLHSYRTEEDLFKTLDVLSDSMNHGLLYVVDWSGSMNASMPGTLEQLILLCMFCRKAAIPFEVYSLTTGGTDAFSTKPGELMYAPNFKMRCYLSSEMSAKEFNDACVNLFSLMPNGTFSGSSSETLVGCTPLNEAITTSVDLIASLRKRTKAQIINAVFLTDGDANTVSSYVDEKGQIKNLYGKNTYLIEDPFTHKVYEFVPGRLTPTLYEILRDRGRIRVVGFYIGGAWEGFFRNLSKAQRSALTKSFKEDGYVVATDWGYDELYITKSGEALRVKDVSLDVDVALDSEKYLDAVAKKFSEGRIAIKKNRMMLDRFITMIA